METNEKLKKVEISAQKIVLPKLDLTPYVGKKCAIENVYTVETKFGYAVKVETVVIDTIGKGDNSFELRGSKLFGLAKDEQGTVGWSDDMQLGEFLKRKDVNHYDKLKGKDVTLQIEVRNGRDWLGFI